MKDLVLGIDASNIKTGGGVTHLVEFLHHANPAKYGFSKVIVWSVSSTLNSVKDFPWLLKEPLPWSDGNYLKQLACKYFAVSRLAKKFECDVVFSPGGLYVGKFIPTVTMSQNLLPFDNVQLKKYSLSFMKIRLLAIRIIQGIGFSRSKGVIFLTDYAYKVVSGVVKNIPKMKIIPHGIQFDFLKFPREQKNIEFYNSENPFRILYVSTIDIYKHQWHVVEAVKILRAKGLPVILELAGGVYQPAMLRLSKTLKKADPFRQFVKYYGLLPRDELRKRYLRADLCLFASSCENLPNILLEGMGTGLPVVCSNCRPMTDILGDAGCYFDPENPKDIAATLESVIEHPQFRAKMASLSFQYAQNYSWERCADETLEFLASIANERIAERS